MSITKRWAIGIVTTAIVLLLILRLFTKHVDGVKTEKTKYLSKLHYEFSGEIDSVVNANHILFHVIRGHLDTEREQELSAELRFWGELVLFRHQVGKIEMMVGTGKYERGDSLYINSDRNFVRIYLKSGEVKEYPLTVLLRGRPF